MRTVLLIIATLIATQQLSAQEIPTTASGPIKQGLTRFHTIDVDAPIKLSLVEIDEGEIPYIVYDTKEVYTSKFSFEVDKNGVLKIRERNDPKRESITEVEVYYNYLENVNIAKADVVVESVIDAPLLDIYISNDAHFIAEINTQDLKINVTGKCRVEISGSALYQTADIATAIYSAANLRTMSTTVSSSHNADVAIDAYQRLEAKSTTGGIIRYKSFPEIYREDVSLFGGEIKQL